jgi:hypothetical protein
VLYKGRAWHRGQRKTFTPFRKHKRPVTIFDHPKLPFD